MNLTERRVPEEALAAIVECAGEAADELGLTESDEPRAVVEAIDEYLHEIQQTLQNKGNSARAPAESTPGVEDLSLTLASLWGQQLVRQFGWQWGSVVFHDADEAEAVGVFSPDRSLAIYPFYFLYQCLTEFIPVTILLAFDVLDSKDRIPPLPANGYENVMDNVHHDQPRE
jgi:hypothetical protein